MIETRPARKGIAYSPMLITLDRHPPGACVIGDLAIDGEPFTSTLEELKNIPAGTYKVVLTESDRAKRGLLWCPGADHDPPNYLLPLLLSVPGHTGIRIHAGNTDKDTEGCILVGHWRGGDFLSNSRDALSSLMDMLEIASIARREIHIEVRDPLKDIA